MSKLKIQNSKLRILRFASNAQGGTKKSNILEYFTHLFEYFRTFSNVFEYFQTSSNVLSKNLRVWCENSTLLRKNLRIWFEKLGKTCAFDAKLPTAQPPIHPLCSGIIFTVIRSQEPKIHL